MTTPATPDTASDAPATQTTPTPAPANLTELATRLAEEVERLDKELGEVDLLINQARTEAGRHEARRASTFDKVATFPSDGPAADLADLNTQLLNLTKRAALMDSQVDVLDGKRRALSRHRDTVKLYATIVGAMDPSMPVATPTAAAAKAKRLAHDAESAGQPAVSRMVLTAQEDLRREIARAMHDGPAQSLTNIVLQAQIVERLVAKDPVLAKDEANALVAMVQQTLEATKTFIFEVRPMVLDDLGLVPTLRRVVRERSKWAGVTIDFDTMGTERRLPMDLESGLFRMIDEALVGYLERAPDHLLLRLDWSDRQLEAVVTAGRTPATPVDADPQPAAPAAPPSGANLPPALAAMMEDRRADAQNAAEVARRKTIVVLPPTAWREIHDRAVTMGVDAVLTAEGSEVHLVLEFPAADPG